MGTEYLAFSNQHEPPLACTLADKARKICGSEGRLESLVYRRMNNRLSISYTTKTVVERATSRVQTTPRLQKQSSSRLARLSQNIKIPALPCSHSKKALRSCIQQAN